MKVDIDALNYYIIGTLIYLYLKIDDSNIGFIMNRTANLKGFIVILFLIVYFLPIVYSQATVTPPPQAVPEGNILTAASLVGSGLYLLWLKGRKGD